MPFFMVLCCFNNTLVQTSMLKWSMLLLKSPWVWHIHCKKRLSIFPSPAGMSLTKMANLFLQCAVVIPNRFKPWTSTCVKNTRREIASASVIEKGGETCGYVVASLTSWLSVDLPPPPQKQLDYGATNCRRGGYYPTKKGATWLSAAVSSCSIT